MNVKITGSSVTFKITEEEMNLLATGKLLEKTVSIGADRFVMRINPQSGHDLRIVMDRERLSLTLCTTKEQIKKLVGMGKSKEGLSVHVNGLDVFLQVDLRADSRPRKKE